MNALIAGIINRLTFRSIERNFAPFRDGVPAQHPVLVSGIFRSGTSITTRILCSGGLDAGPAHHLLQPKGKYEALMPDGFMENYFFMELSRYVFHLCNASGDHPPENSAVAALDMTKLRDEDFRAYAILKLRETRITNKNKADVLQKASVHAPLAYIAHSFKDRAVIKNPHFSVLEPYFDKLFPHSPRVIVFRNPDDWMRSAKAVTSNADYQLFDSYYRYYLNRQDGRYLFFDYDQLRARPEASIEKLFDALQLNRSHIADAVQLVHASKPSVGGSGSSQLFDSLKERAINK